MTPQIMELEKKLKSLKKKTPEKADVLNELGWELWIRDPQRAIRISEKGFEISKQINYDRGLAYAKRNLALMLYARTDVEKAMQYIFEALEWFRQNDDVVGEAYASIGLSFLYWGFGDYQKGFDTVTRALKLLEKSEDTSGLAWVLNSLGQFYFDWKDYEQALSYFKKAHKLFSEQQSNEGKARTLNGMGNALYFLGDTKKALNYQQLSLKLNCEAKNKFGESKTLNDIGLILQNSGDYKAALEYHQSSLTIREKLKYPQGISTNLLDIGQIYIKQKKYDQALVILKKALDVAEKIKAKPKMCRAHYGLASIFKELGQFEQAYYHHEKFHEIEEEVFHEDSEKKLKNLKSAYEVETSRKEAEIYRLKNVELKEKNEQLQETLRQLHAAQAQLIQTGKIAALGNLVAGIIHEINNPVGSIISGVDISEKAVSRVIDELNILENNASAKEEIKRLLEILQQVVQNTQRGAERIATIMESLKNFSKIDSSKFQKVNIHTGIDSALTLLNHEIMQKIEVKKHYGPIPEIFCNPSELNQVFMNILMNSVHSIENSGTITIRTGVSRGQVQIRISDNGKGIPPEKIDTLFDPGFISKNSNIRMRTGLFSSSNIVRKHGGQIHVKSEVGKGTTFIIMLPVKQPETQPVVESK